MAGRSAYLQNKYIDWLFRGESFTPPSQIYVALLTTNPSDDAGSGLVEATGTGYSRATPGASSRTTWIASQDDYGDAGSDAISSGTTGKTANGSALSFGTVGAGGWGGSTAPGVALYDAATGGNLLYWVALGTAIDLSVDNVISVAAGNLRIAAD